MMNEQGKSQVDKGHKKGFKNGNYGFRARGIRFGFFFRNFWVFL